jgi:type IV pilus assembly protein PilB
VETATKDIELGDLLVEEGLVTEAQLERARRIAGRLQNARPVGEVLVELGQLAHSEYDRIIRIHRSRLSLVRILQEEAILDDEQVRAYEAGSARNPGDGDRKILVDGGLVSEDQFLRALSTKYDIPFIEPDISLIDVSLLSRISTPYLIRHRVIPVRMTDDHLILIMADPLDSDTIQDIETTYGKPVEPCAAASAKIVEAIKALEQLRETEEIKVATTLQYRDIQESQDDDDDGQGAVRIVDHLLHQAIQMEASDLHIEPLKSKLRVRVRVDGVLRHLTDLPADFTPRVVSRIKVLAGMDIAERRLHQDGRLFVRLDAREIDIRVSSYASVFGETLVMRLLDRQRGLIPLEGLGFEKRILANLRDVVLRGSSGLILVTGPTGSGKTTTMYSFVDYINNDGLKVITCENPVEYVLEGTTQCSSNEDTGPTSADSLRSIVRQDPDIIVVSEIRDGITANMSVEAALTGHLVFSTFHTEDSVGAVIRLMEMGLEPYIVSSTLVCIAAQRLLRRICEHCRRQGSISRQDLRFLELSKDDLRGLQILEGAGCPECGGTGYKGRMGIHEVLLLNDDFRDAILRRAPSKELKAIARGLPGFLTLQEDGFLKVVEGKTTLSELANKVPRDPAARPLAQLQEVAAMRRFR